MRNPKYHLYLTPDERRTVINSLIELRNELIKNHHPIIYTNLLTSCKLTAHLADIDGQAEDMFFRLVKQFAEKEGVTEQLKSDNQMLWVQRMNNIHNQAKEINFTISIPLN